MRSSCSTWAAVGSGAVTSLGAESVHAPTSS